MAGTLGGSMENSSLTSGTRTEYITKYSDVYIRGFLRLMDKILHDLKDPKLWELWYIPYNG